MPKVALTAAQREQQALERRADWLANGLAAYKVREGLSLKSFGKKLGLCDKTIARILNGDYTVSVPLCSMWKLEAISRKMHMEEKEVSV